MSITNRRRIQFETEAVIIVLIVQFIEFNALLCRGERLTLALVPANGQQLRPNGVLRDEAIVVERLKERHVRNPLLRQEIAKMMRLKGAECLRRDDVRQPLAGELRGCLQPLLLNPGMNLQLSYAKNPRQCLDRKAIAADVSDLQVVSTQRTADGICAPAEYPGGFFYRMTGQRLAQVFKFFFGPAPMLFPALQVKLKNEQPTRLTGATGLPLQAANELIEFWA
jgi:hypothetical protein